MTIFIDIGHPAHVHYFKNFIHEMKKRGHQTVVSARNRKYVFELLDAYKIPYHNRGTGSKSTLGKIIYLFKAVWFQYRLAKKYKVDLFLDFGTVYAGPASGLLRKPYLAFEDTETAMLYQRLIKPFVAKVYTSNWFEVDLGAKQERFAGFMELCYLHPNWFTPDKNVVSELGIAEGEHYVIVRFVDWTAWHDRGHQGMSHANKLKLIDALSAHGKVFISSDEPLPDSLEQYQFPLPAHRMHHAIAFATLLVGESSTMASEASMLGTPSIFMDNDGRGYPRYLEDEYGLVRNFTESDSDQELAIQTSAAMFIDDSYKQKAINQREVLLGNCIDVTAFMISEVEKYLHPKRSRSMQHNTADFN